MALPPPDPTRRARLNALKLGALVRDHVGAVDGQPDEFGAGAALARDGEVWVLLDERAESRFGAALVWATRRSATRLHLVVDEGDTAGLLARRAAYVTVPTSVWQVEGRALVPATVSPLPPPAPVDARLLAFDALIREGGAEPIVEHGVLTGEVDGLEVCRAVIDPFTDAARLEVGIGAHDREAFQLLHGDRPTADALRHVVEYVAAYRFPGASPHALNRLAGERALRRRLVASPGLIGARELAIAAPPLPRLNVKDPTQCFATGVDADGTPLVVAVAVGGDLDLPLAGAEARVVFGDPTARLVLAVPARDAGPLLAAVAATVQGGAEIRAVAPVGAA